ncbi:hypothetical protein [Streptomyces sp. NPDC096132]|uniref:hypothetical protein n=1 Tax=Streptomyces sp. NPDC096132 TaxID=3366075 RepID=UPI0037FEF99B
MELRSRPERSELRDRAATKLKAAFITDLCRDSVLDIDTASETIRRFTLDLPVADRLS